MAGGFFHFPAWAVQVFPAAEAGGSKLLLPTPSSHEVLYSPVHFIGLGSFLMAYLPEAFDRAVKSKTQVDRGGIENSALF